MMNDTGLQRVILHFSYDDLIQSDRLQISVAINLKAIDLWNICKMFVCLFWGFYRSMPCLLSSQYKLLRLFDLRKYPATFSPSWSV